MANARCPHWTAVGAIRRRIAPPCRRAHSQIFQLVPRLFRQYRCGFDSTMMARIGDISTRGLSILALLLALSLIVIFHLGVDRVTGTDLLLHSLRHLGPRTEARRTVEIAGSPCPPFVCRSQRTRLSHRQSSATRLGWAGQLLTNWRGSSLIRKNISPALCVTQKTYLYKGPTAANNFRRAT
jgi:hypothetical protein